MSSRSTTVSLSLLALALALLASACSASIGGGATNGECDVGSFVCGDGSCVPQAEACNGTESCADGSDEDDCATRCERNQYRCRDGTTCVEQTALCDEREDCPGGDDEATCGTGDSGCPDGFACPGGMCLPATAKCNGMAECPGGEDEARETCAPVTCPNRDDLRCEDGRTCVPKARQCDGVPHCGDGGDEGATACAGQGDGREPGKDEGGPDKPNDGGDGPDKPGNGGGGARPCGAVPATGRCAKSDVLEWCDGGRLERQSCRRQGMVCGRGTTGDAACVTPAGGGGPTGPQTCAGIDAGGSCQGNSLVFCVNGQVRTQDCARSGKTCTDAGTTASCTASAGVDACAGVTATGKCNGNRLEWCEGGAKRTYDCAASSMTCGPVTGEELAFGCRASSCAGVSYFGECQGDTLRYCQDDNVLAEVDCRGQYGLGCGLQNETIGNNCVAESDAGGACGTIDYAGTCQGDKVVWCNGATLDVYDCATQGMACGDGSGGTVGKWCVPRSGAGDSCGAIDFQGTCQGDVAMWCASGQLKSRDCGNDGMSCGLISSAVGYYCTNEATSEAPTCQGRCSAGAIAGSAPACFCDSLCAANGDCCGGTASYADVCGAAPTAPTCEGSCGALQPAAGSSPACYCDDACTANNDCCGDYVDVCQTFDA